MKPTSYVVSAFSRTVAIACVLVLSACGSKGDAPGASASSSAPIDRKSLRPVSLPDLTKSEPAVRKHLQDAFASLTSKIADTAVSTADLAEAYGRVGMMCLAAEFRDAAEPALLDAQGLAPGDFRWPYYLGHLYRGKADPARSTEAFERARNLKPDDVAALVWLGDSYLDAGRAADAQPLFEKAVSLQPQSRAALFGLGRASLCRRGKGLSRVREGIFRQLALASHR